MNKFNLIIKFEKIYPSKVMLEEKIARQAARRLFHKFHLQGDHLNAYELSSMLQSTYQILNLPFKPSNKDIALYQQVLDTDKDGKVSLRDLQSIAIASLAQQQSQNLYTNTNINSVSRAYPESNIQNYGQSYTSIYTENKAEQKNFHPYSHSHLQQSANEYSSHYNTESGLSDQNSNQVYPQNEYGRPYSQKVQEYLAVIGQVFMRYADPQTFTITQKDVGNLLTDTYTVLGRQGYEPTEDDIIAWMKLCDINNDGRVEFQEYEFFVVKSLERSGMELYSD